MPEEYKALPFKPIDKEYIPSTSSSARVVPLAPQEAVERFFVDPARQTGLSFLGDLPKTRLARQMISKTLSALYTGKMDETQAVDVMYKIGSKLGFSDREVFQIVDELLTSERKKPSG